jgi:hypothetical protein
VQEEALGGMAMCIIIEICITGSRAVVAIGVERWLL